MVTVILVSKDNPSESAFASGYAKTLKGAISKAKKNYIKRLGTDDINVEVIVQGHKGGYLRYDSSSL